MEFFIKKFLMISVSFLIFSFTCISGLHYKSHVSAASGAMIKLVNTDKARYTPGEPAEIYVDLVNTTGTSFTGSVTLYFRHLGSPAGADQVKSVVLGDNEAKTLTFNWVPPTTDYRGYLVEVWVRDQTGKIVDSGSTAVDVSSDWTKFPRYGYVSEFSDTTDASNKTWELKNYHINGLQFYDWQWKHHIPNPDPSHSYWQDIGNRWISRATVNSFIDNAHRYNMKAMNYNLINGSFDNYWEDGVQVAWGLFKDGNGDYDPGRQDAHVLPKGWASSKIYLSNPANKDWQDYINSKEAEVFNHFAFDGWHIDSLGPRGDLYDWNKNYVNLQDTYGSFINSAKSYLKKDIVFNSVEAYGQDQASQSNADFVYSELWDWNPTNDDYSDLVSLVERSKARSNKAVVFAAYMNRNYSKNTPGGTQRNFNEASIRLADAAMFAAGASHIELGDGGYMLSDEYFPNKNLVMSASLKTAMKSYYTFLTAYENLLRDEVVRGSNKVVLTDQVNHPSSNNGQAGKIWTFSKAKNGYDIVHLINLKNNTSTKWRDDNADYPTPDEILNIPVKIYYDGNLPENAKVWWATPDAENGKANSLSFTKGNDSQGNYISLTVPRLLYWDMVWIEKNPDETGEILYDDYESVDVGAQPEDWSPVSGTWSVNQPSGATKEMAVTSSSGGIIKYKNGFDTGNYSVEGHVYIPDTTNNGAILARVQKDGGFYQLELKEGNKYKLYKFNGTEWREIKGGEYIYSPGYHHLKLTCIGNEFTIEIDLNKMGTVTDLDEPFMDGTVGLRSETGNRRWDNIKVTAY
ncbi:glycoside hydrolase family 66 protein [Mesobacillus foraminis]|uniref:glycoside hydrolase family 66 protein n=1 Tax=Mesobacillus foraminis TaxID=279826 RepID=UPI0039A12229